MPVYLHDYYGEGRTALVVSTRSPEFKADPSKSDRQIAETVKASPTTVGTVRAKMEANGDVSNLDTRRDTKGREQPAHRIPSTPNTVCDTPSAVQRA